MEQILARMLILIPIIVISLYLLMKSRSPVDYNDIKIKVIYEPIQYTTTPISGIPAYFLNHPNNFSKSPNQVIFYESSEDFLNSNFYIKYIGNITSVPNGNTIQKQLYRIVFMSMNKSDTSAYYLDNNTIQDYKNMLQECQDSEILLVPAELLAQNIT